MVQAMYVRFQSAVPNARGAFPGVFALVNGLARHGLLTSADQDWVRRANADADDAYPDPSTTDPLSYDPTVHPGRVPGSGRTPMTCSVAPRHISTC